MSGAERSRRRRDRRRTGRRCVRIEIDEVNTPEALRRLRLLAENDDDEDSLRLAIERLLASLPALD